MVKLLVLFLSAFCAAFPWFSSSLWYLWDVVNRICGVFGYVLEPACKSQLCMSLPIQCSVTSCCSLKLVTAKVFRPQNATYRLGILFGEPDVPSMPPAAHHNQKALMKVWVHSGAGKDLRLNAPFVFTLMQIPREERNNLFVSQLSNRKKQNLSLGFRE